LSVYTLVGCISDNESSVQVMIHLKLIYFSELPFSITKINKNTSGLYTTQVTNTYTYMCSIIILDLYLLWLAL